MRRCLLVHMIEFAYMLHLFFYPVRMQLKDMKISWVESTFFLSRRKRKKSICLRFRLDFICFVLKFYLHLFKLSTRLKCPLLFDGVSHNYLLTFHYINSWKENEADMRLQICMNAAQNAWWEFGQFITEKQLYYGSSKWTTYTKDGWSQSAIGYFRCNQRFPTYSFSEVWHIALFI